MQLQIARKTNQVDDFKNLSFRNELNFRAKIAYDEIKKQGEKIKYTELVCVGSSIKHYYNFTIFLDFKTFAESLYNGSISLEVAKLKQRNMEYIIIKLEDYKPKKKEIKTQKDVVLPNAIEFYKGRKMILIAFENNVFPLPKQYPSANVNDWKENEMDSTHIILRKLMNYYHQLSIEKKD